MAAGDLARGFVAVEVLVEIAFGRVVAFFVALTFAGAAEAGSLGFSVLDLPLTAVAAGGGVCLFPFVGEAGTGSAGCDEGAGTSSATCFSGVMLGCSGTAATSSTGVLGASTGWRGDSGIVSCKNGLLTRVTSSAATGALSGTVETDSVSVSMLNRRRETLDS